MLFPGDIHISSTFIVESPRPIDDRMIVANIAVRDSIILDRRYNLMRVDVLDDGTGTNAAYQMVLGTDPSNPDDIMNPLNWVEQTNGFIAHNLNDHEDVDINYAAIQDGFRLVWDLNSQAWVARENILIAHKLGNHEDVDLTDVGNRYRLVWDFNTSTWVTEAPFSNEHDDLGGLKLAANEVAWGHIDNLEQDLFGLKRFVDGIEIKSLAFIEQPTETSASIPALMLHPNGEVMIKNIPPSPWTIDNPNIYYPAGNVGINTSTPAFSLTVDGSFGVIGVIPDGEVADKMLVIDSATGQIKVRSEVTFTNVHADLSGLELAGDEIVWGHINNLIQDIFGLKTFVEGAAVSSLVFTHQPTDTDLDIPALMLHPSGEVMVQNIPPSPWTVDSPNIYYPVGNVGINTDSPGFSLTIDGTFGIIGTLDDGVVSDKMLVIDGVTGQVKVRSESPGRLWTLNQDDSIFYSAGYVAIGIDIPEEALHVVGHLVLDTPEITTEAYFALVLDPVTKKVLQKEIIPGDANLWQPGLIEDTIYYSLGPVGIGTDSPTGGLHIVKTSDIASTVVLMGDSSGLQLGVGTYEFFFIGLESQVPVMGQAPNDLVFYNNHLSQPVLSIVSVDSTIRMLQTPNSTDDETIPFIVRDPQTGELKERTMIPDGDDSLWTVNLDRSIYYDKDRVAVGTSVPLFGFHIHGTFGITYPIPSTTEQFPVLVRDTVSGEVMEKYIDTGYVVYDVDKDSYYLEPTADGQTQDLGQEVFLHAYNSDLSANPAATARQPRVFIGIGSLDGKEYAQTVIKPVAGDYQDGATLGVNTTDFSVDTFGKLATYGQLNDVDTSAWMLNQTLYLSTTLPGEFTNVKPDINAIAIAKVLKVDPTEGILFVNTVSNSRVDADISPVGIERYYLTGDEVTTTEGTFYLAFVSDWGTTPEAIEVVVVGDNQIVPVSQEHLSPIFPEDQPLIPGVRDGLVEFEHDSTGGLEKIYVEVYLADDQGAPIDSGIATEPVGTLGVTVLLIYETALLDNDPNEIFKEELKGLASEGVIVPANHRLRFRLLCEKVGTQGGNKDFTIYYGAEHNTFLNSYKTYTGANKDNEIFLYKDLTSTVALGGIGIGDSFDPTMTVRTLWEALLAPYVPPILNSLVISPAGPVEVGAAVLIAGATVSWTLDSTASNPTNASVSGPGFGDVTLTTSPMEIAATAGTIVQFFTNTSQQWVFSASDLHGGALASRSRTMFWYYMWHFGGSPVIVSDDATAQSVTDYMQQKSLLPGKADTVNCGSYNEIGANFTYIIYAAKYGELNAVIHKDALDVLTAFEMVGDFNYLNEQGHSDLYKVYKSISPGAFADGDKLEIY